MSQGRFKVDHGKAVIETLVLSNASEKMPLAGSADIQAGSYALSGDLQLAKPEGFPALKLRRASGEADYKVDTKPLEIYIIKNLPPPPAAVLQPEKPVVPAAPMPDKDHPISDILKRLDENDASKPLAPQPDVNKTIQQIQTQDLMQKDTGDGLPLPLTP